MMGDKVYTIVEPSDVIYTEDGELYCKLYSLWTDSVMPAVEIGDLPVRAVPVDIWLSKAIPLKDFCIDWNMWGHPNSVYYSVTETGVYLQIYDKRGALLTAEMSVFNDNDGNEDYWGYSIIEELTSPDIEINNNALSGNLQMLMCFWYGIQISLLHPQIQMLFKNPTREKVYTREGTGKDRKRVVKYVRKHYITAEGIDEALYGHRHRDFERKTMAWYVIGHWRQYKNGTRKFINGYWKGPLREMKRNLDGGRIRQLAIQEV